MKNMVKYKICCGVLIESIHESLCALNDAESGSDVDFLYWDVLHKLDTLKSFKHDILFQSEFGVDSIEEG